MSGAYPHLVNGPTPAGRGPASSASLAPGSSFLRTLGGRYYTDPAVFEQEQARIFSAVWICAVRVTDLPSTGDFQTVEVGGESIVAVRGRDQVLRAFLNVCRHRGSQLCSIPTGKLRGAIQCPYHAWSYAFDGRLVGAPNIAEMSDEDQRSRHLLEVASREWLGYLWVCLADAPPPFEASVVSQVVERLGSVEQIDHYAMESLAVGRRIEYDVKANWKLIVENFMECYHCGTLHPELVAVLPEFRKGQATQSQAGYGASFGEAIDGFTVAGTKGFERLPGLVDEQDRRYYGMTVTPQVIINLVPDHVILHRVFPLAADRTLIICDWLFARDVVESGADLSRSVELFDRVNRQDLGAVEATQPAMRSRAYRGGGVLVPVEHHMALFHQWVRSMLGEVAASE
jgi:glycine betaine catabolism A